MKSNQFRSYKINRTSLKRLIVLTILGMVSIFIITGMLTSLPGYGLASNQVQEWSDSITVDDFIYLLGRENKYFTQALPEDSEPPNISKLVLQVATSINLKTLQAYSEENCLVLHCMMDKLLLLEKIWIIQLFPWNQLHLWM